MIVRIATEGQYELADEHDLKLTELDNEVVAAAAAGDEAQFRKTFGRLLEFIRGNGTQLPDDELKPSDLIVPPPDVSAEETRSEFSGEGLIPG